MRPTPELRLPRCTRRRSPIASALREIQNRRAREITREEQFAPDSRRARVKAKGFSGTGEPRTLEGGSWGSFRRVGDGPQDG
jgi:hypothetical protein